MQIAEAVFDFQCGCYVKASVKSLLANAGARSNWILATAVRRLLAMVPLGGLSKSKQIAKQLNLSTKADWCLMAPLWAE
jgi:hypothetical protein